MKFQFGNRKQNFYRGSPSVKPLQGPIIRTHGLQRSAPFSAECSFFVFVFLITLSQSDFLLCFLSLYFHPQFHPYSISQFTSSKESMSVSHWSCVSHLLEKIKPQTQLVLTLVFFLGSINYGIRRDIWYKNGHQNHKSSTKGIYFIGL